MSFSETFIRRPVATTLLTLAVTLAGAVAFRLLPVAPLPRVDYPTVMVSASLPGAAPETMAATVATPLERALGRIAGVTELTSSSTRGATSVTLQFDLSRDINGACREVQAAINAARRDLPAGLPANPTYRKMNPSESPIILLALTSEKLSREAMYDAASTQLAPKIAQIEGVGDVNVGGGAAPAVRVTADGERLAAHGLSYEDVRRTLAATNANAAKGFLDAEGLRRQIAANDRAPDPGDYPPLLLAWRNGAALRLGDVASVRSGPEDVYNAGLLNGKPAIILVVTRQPDANIIETVDRIRARLPELRALTPAGATLSVALDRSLTIRESLTEVERALLLSVALVTLVVLLFLGDRRAAAIPAVVVPVSIAGTFAVMWSAGFSLNNISLMALTIATGFVVDDAIVVMENIARHTEAGMSRLKAAILGAREVSFTVVSISVSLVAVFIPILLMGGLVGRLFREFAVTLTAAIAVSLVVSLTVTPMMCARFLRERHGEADTRPGLAGRLLARISELYARSLDAVLRRRRTVAVVFLAVVVLNVALYRIIPKGFFPQQDTGVLMGSLQADQSVSFESMRGKLLRAEAVVRADPAVESVSSFFGGGGRGRADAANSARFMVALKPPAERDPAEAVVVRLRRAAAGIPGARLLLISPQDIRVGGRPGSGAYQYTVLSDDIATLDTWAPKIRAALAELPELADVNADTQSRGMEIRLEYDRDKLASLGLTVDQVNRTLYDAYGQRQVSTVFKSLNQYRVVLEAPPEAVATPESLRDIRVFTPAGVGVPLMSFAAVSAGASALSVNHQSQFAATTVSFNLAPGVPLSEADAAIREAVARLDPPTSVTGGMQGAAKVFQESVANQPLLILAVVQLI